MSEPNDLEDRVRFQQRALDANGERLGPWPDPEDGVTVACGIRWLRRGETVLQDRLQGQSPAVLKVWSSAFTRAVDNSWRAIDLRTGRILDIKSPGEPSRDRGMIEFLAQADGGGGGV